MHRPLVAAIVPTHNRKERLLHTLRCLHEQEGVTPAIIVVFDRCTDGSRDAVLQAFPTVHAVEGDGNLWWSGAINAGIAAARALKPDYLCLMSSRRLAGACRHDKEDNVGKDNFGHRQ